MKLGLLRRVRLLSVKLAGLTTIVCLPPQLSSVTDAQGKFVLETPYMIRTPNDSVPVAAVDREGRAAIVVRSIGELDKPLNLTLTPMRRLRVTLQFPGPGPELAEVRWEDDQGRGFLGHALRKDESNRSRYVAEQRLPKGSYRLVVKETAVSEELIVPVDVTAGKEDLDVRVHIGQPSQLRLLEGRPAPELAVKWPEGGEKSLQDFRGKVIVLDFWGSWCVPCVQEMPALMDMADKFKNDPVAWLAVHDASLQRVNEMQDKVRQLEKSWGRSLNLVPVLDEQEPGASGHGGVTCSRYGVRIWPTLIVVDRNGRIVGYRSKNDIEATVRELLGR